MANDFAFLFYPGDYLRDTQCLSEKVQVSYDRIMCEHMRNICITQQQLKFFTKKLTEEEIAELKLVLTETEEGFQIDWVVASIRKRKAYSQSRRENRAHKNENISLTHENTSSSYDEHMENEIEIEDVKGLDNKKEIVKGEKSEIYQKCIKIYFDWFEKRVGVIPKMDAAGGKAMKSIIKYLGMVIIDKKNEEEIPRAWNYTLSKWDMLDEYLKKQTKLTQIDSNFQNILNLLRNQPKNGKIKHAEAVIEHNRTQADRIDRGDL